MECAALRSAQPCCICLNETRTAAVPCGHAICAVCSTRWWTLQPTCPTCRRDVCGLAPHADSGWLVKPIGPIGPAAPSMPILKHLTVSLPRGSHAGVTLTNDLRGVRVLRTDPLDQCARSGLHKGCIVHSINEIACTDHASAVRVIEAATEASVEMRLLVSLPRRRRLASMLASMIDF